MHEDKKNTLANSAASQNTDQNNHGNNKTLATVPQATMEFGRLPKEAFDAEYLRLIEFDLAKAQAHIKELPDCDRRGLTLETYEHFHCGYLPDWVLTKSRAEFNCGLYVNELTGEPKHLPPPSPRIIIPTPSMQHFNGVATPRVRHDIDKAFWKQHAGTMELFGDTNTPNADLIVVVEGEFDAMSIWQCSRGQIAAVAILGCGNWKKTLLPKLKDLRGKKLLLLLDADAAGKKAAEKFLTELLKRGYLAVTKFLYDALPNKYQKDFGCRPKEIDANSLLVNYGDQFLNDFLKKIIADAAPDFDKLADQINQQNLFMQAQAKLADPDFKEPAKMEKTSTCPPDENVDREEIRRILKDFVHAKKLDRNDWRNVGMILKRYGFTLEDWQEWSKDDLRYSAESCATQWKSFLTVEELKGKGYTIATLIQLAKEHGYKPLKKTNKKSHAHRVDSPTPIELEHSGNSDPQDDDQPTDDSSAKIDSLKANLREAQKELADFNAEKDTAFEKLRDCQAFDNTTVFSAEIIKAAAFAKNYDAELYSAFARDVKQYGDKHKDVKADMNSWKGSVKNKALELDARRCDLVTRINQLRAQIETMKFAASSDMLIPTLPDYQITQEFGIVKVSGEKLIPVAPRPIVISSQVKSVDSGILKFQLAQMTPKGKWQKFPTFDAATISDSRAIVKLSNAGLRVTSNNAALLVDYFDKLRTQLEEDLPMTYEVARCGWHEFGGKEYFIDPRRPCVFSDDDDKNISVEVSSQSQFATCLTTRGSLDKWREAYELAKKYPVARFMTASAVSPILLKVLGERNFLTYVFGKTRGGKTTAATLASSTGGDEKIIRSFDSTRNGLAGAAADVSDYCFIVDEKQVADNKLKETFDNVIYAIANGIGRLRLNKDGSVRKVQDWRTIALMTGETRMIEDNTIGGADTRLLSINAGDEVMPPDVCKQIRAIVKNNCGHALPLVIDKTQSKSPEFWQEAYEDIQKVFAEDYPDHLDEHRRYIATVTLGDAILNDALYGSGEEALLDAIGNAKEIFKLIPLTAEFDTTQREIDFVRDFVSRNQNQFISADNKIEFIRGGVFGKLEEVFVYIAVGVLKDACKSANFDYGKLVDDLVAAGYFVPDDKTTDKVKTPYKFVLKKLGKTPTRCFRINRDRFDE